MNSTERVIHTQAELDTALADGVRTIIVDSPQSELVVIRDSGWSRVIASGLSTVSAFATVRASGSATVIREQS